MLGHLEGDLATSRRVDVSGTTLIRFSNVRHDRPRGATDYIVLEGNYYGQSDVVFGTFA